MAALPSVFAQRPRIDDGVCAALWNMDVAKVRAAAAQVSREWGDGLDTLASAEFIGIVLLVAKGGLDRDTPRRRVAAFKTILDVGCKIGLEQHRRLCSLANVSGDGSAVACSGGSSRSGGSARSADDGGAGTYTAPLACDSQTFEAFTELEGLEAWGTHRVPSGCCGRTRVQSTVFFRDVVPNCINRSGQLAGLCFMHGAVAVLHYAICHYTGRGDHRTIHIPSFLVRQLTGRELWRYVSDVDSGGNSTQFLQKLACRSAPDDLVVLNHMELCGRRASARVVKLFKKHGPALVSGFSTNAAFKRTTAFSFLDADRSHTDEDGSHAMALVGWRHAGTGDIRFLLQNWWKSKQFIEVNLAYLASRRASLTWLQEPITAFPDPSVVHDAPWAEFDFDGPDREAELEF